MGGRSDRLTDAQAALVLRRAAELEQRAEPKSNGISSADLERIAAEAGLSREAVAQALAEVRVDGAAPPTGPVALGRILRRGHHVVTRNVPLGVSALRQRADAFFAEQGFRVERDFGSRIVYCRDDSLLAIVKRAVDFRRQLRLAETREVTLDLIACGDDGAAPSTRVTFTVGMGELRKESLAAIGLAVVLAAAATQGPHTVPFLGASVGVAVAIGAAAYGKTLRKTRSLDGALQRFLDFIEHRPELESHR
jgi:hypothetical protein